MAKNSEATLLLKIKSSGESVLSKTKAALGDIKTWATAAFAALTSGAAIHAFKESEAATNSLNQSLITQGIYTKALSESYSKMASELQSLTTFDDDAIKAAQAKMQAYLGQTKISKELMMATLDLATAEKTDLSSAAEKVGKAIGTKTNALARSGIALDANASKSEKMSKVLAGLNTLHGGQAEAAAQGLGALDQMKNAFGDLLEVIGERLAPYVIKGAQSITAFAVALQNNQTFITGMDYALKGLSQVAAVVKMNFLNLKDLLVGYFSTVYAAVKKLSSGDLAGAWSAIKDGFADTTTNITNNAKGFLADSKAIWADNTKAQAAADDETLKKKKIAADKARSIRESAQFDDEAFFKARDEKELNRLITNERLKTDMRLLYLNSQIANETDATKKYELEIQKRKFLDEQYAADDRKREQDKQTFAEFLNSERITNFDKTMSDLSQLQNSKFGPMVALGKAAAIAHIGIDTARGTMSAYRAAVDLIPGPAGVAAGVAAGIAVAGYGGEQIAKVADIQLAEGGIVKATPGGVRATIGEGGQDEAVIPLPKSGSLFGSTINIIVQGGFLGDPQQAREYAVAVDKELFRLRQSNESIAFDRGVI